MPGGWAWAWALKTTFRRLWVSATESLAPVTDAELAAMCDGQLIKLVVVGLGNYGSLASRHSVGMAAVRHIAAARGGSWKSARREWKANVCLLPEVGLALVEPRLFMNDNGRSVARALKMLKLSPSELVLLHDDLDAALGKVRIKEGGSASGHKGVQSTIQHVNTQEFRRVRIGIGRPADRADVPAFVLEDFVPDEARQVEEQVLDEVANFVRSFLPPAPPADPDSEARIDTA